MFSSIKFYAWPETVLVRSSRVRITLISLPQAGEVPLKYVSETNNMGITLELVGDEESQSSLQTKELEYVS